MKRKGSKLEPFAYVPLHATAMSGKHGAAAVGRFAGVTATTSRAGRSSLKREAGGKRKRGDR